MLQVPRLPKLIRRVSTFGVDDVLQTSRHARREGGEVLGAVSLSLPLPTDPLPELIGVEPAWCVSQVLGHVAHHQTPDVLNHAEVWVLRRVGQRLDLCTNSVAVIKVDNFVSSATA